MKKEKKSTSTSDIDWPQHPLLVLLPTGKSLLLNNQHDYVGLIVQHAIAKLTEETLLIDAFLDVDKRINYHCRLLINMAHKLKSEIPQIRDIYDHLKKDTSFCDALGKLVCNTKSFSYNN